MSTVVASTGWPRIRPAARRTGQGLIRAPWNGRLRRASTTLSVTKESSSPPVAPRMTTPATNWYLLLDWVTGACGSTTGAVVTM